MKQKIFLLIIGLCNIVYADYTNNNFLENYKKELDNSSNNLIVVVKTEPHTINRNNVLFTMDKIELSDELTRIYIDNNKTSFLNNYFSNTIILFDKSKNIFINAIFSNFSYNNINNMIKYELKLQEF